jgi:HSP20 family molecular chaperone IbpA
VMERSYGSFARSIRLPFTVNPDQVQATFKADCYPHRR